MISKRLKSIADFVDKEDALVDVGCDHGLLGIYLVQKKLCKKVIASDINKNALQSAIDNIKKNNLDIETVLSDGLDIVDMSNINTLVISGMGTSTIFHILNSNKIKNVKKIILQSNNYHELLRSGMNKIDYYLEQEKIVLDKGKWYVTMLFTKSSKKNTKKEIEYGYLNNLDYIDYLINHEKAIIKKISFFCFKVRFRHYKTMLELKRIKKENIYKK